MAKQTAQDAANAKVKTHYEQDQELAARIGHMDPSSGINKIPVRVATEHVSSHERRETIIKQPGSI
jgi:hypothetical protein